MVSDVLHLADDGQSYCRLIDPSTGPVHVPIRELNSQGALFDTRLVFQANDYLDITLHLTGVSARPLFAHVVGVEKEGLRVRWLHFDPGDEPKLRSLLESFRTGSLKPEDRASAAGSAAPVQSTVIPSMGESPKAGTRRIVRPSTVFTPFSSPEAPAKPTEASRTTEGGERQGTRRVMRPSASALTPSASGPVSLTPMPTERPNPADQVLDLNQVKSKALGEDSGGHVVIAPTAKFERMRDDRVANPESTETAGSAKIVIGQDGKLDIGATIRNKAKTVRASELAARHDRVRVLNMATIKALIQEAVGEAVQHVTAMVGDGEKKRLLEEAEQGFQERLKVFQADKLGAEAKAKQLQDQLKMAQDLLEQERKRTISADQFTVSEVGLGEIEEKMKRVLERAIRDGNVSPELQEQLRAMIAHILDSERERIKTQEMEAQNAKIDLLEKKIKRLASTLDETERQRDEAQEIAKLLEEQGGGLRNIMAAGLKDTDSNKKKKLALMKEILEINRKMREELGVTYNRDDVAAAKVDEVIAKLPDRPYVPPSEANAPGARVPGEAAAAVDSGADADGYKPAAASAEAATPDDDAPIVNPDDEPWEVKQIQVLSDEERDEAKIGVKRIKAGAHAAPPLRGAAAAADDTAVQGGSDGVDPDGQPWDALPIDNGGTGAVKRIAVPGKEPPPLGRQSSSGS